jgi:hypothetical protein
MRVDILWRVCCPRFRGPNEETTTVIANLVAGDKYRERPVNGKHLFAMGFVTRYVDSDRSGGV